jgi:hypothetical protein
MRYANHDLATGETYQTSGAERFGYTVWCTGERSGYYLPISRYDWVVLDWGDAATPGVGELIGGFAMSYATAETLPTRIDTTMLYFAEENGWNSSGRVYLAGFSLTALPTGDPDGTFNGWTITIDLDTSGSQFTIDGSDIDGDGLVDFGYSYYFEHQASTGQPPLDSGPTIAGFGPNAPPCATGIDGFFDAFDGSIGEPNAHAEAYAGTHWLGAQFSLELFASEANIPEGCPNPGAGGKFCVADIDSGGYPGDCLVDLADLAQLLSNYGMTSGAVWGDGDVDPLQPGGGDGDVDLGDLAELLSQYGDDCN